MNKIAQRRGFFNKLRESVNAPGEAVTGTFSPEFTQLMDTLREVDDEAREQAADLKDMLKVARSNFNRREYMTTITYLGKFHERLELVRMQFLKLDKEVNAVHNEFLFGDLDPEHRKYLFEKMPERHKPKPKVKLPETKKEAGVKDWWHNLTTDRGRALKFWEKRFPKKAKEVKRQTEKMLNRSEMFLNLLQSMFKTLASHRATRSLEEYMKVSNSFVQKYDSYDDAFAEYFTTTVAGFIKSQKEFEADKARKESDLEGLTNKPADIPTGTGESGGNIIPPEVEKEVKKEEEKKEEEIGLVPESPLQNVPAKFPEKKIETAPITEVDMPSLPVPSSELELSSLSPEPPLPAPVAPSKKGPLPAYTPLGLSMRNESILSSSPPTLPSNQLEFAPTTIPQSPAIPRDMAALENPTFTPEIAQKFHYYTPPASAPATLPTEPAPSTTPESRPTVIEGPPKTQPHVPRTPTMIGTAAHQFVETITKLAGDNPLVMAAEIIKFAKSIEANDKDTSARLLVVAKNLLK